MARNLEIKPMINLPWIHFSTAFPKPSGFILDFGYLTTLLVINKYYQGMHKKAKKNPHDSIRAYFRKKKEMLWYIRVVVALSGICHLLISVDMCGFPPHFLARREPFFSRNNAFFWLNSVTLIKATPFWLQKLKRWTIIKILIDLFLNLCSILDICRQFWKIIETIKSLNR